MANEYHHQQDLSHVDTDITKKNYKNYYRNYDAPYYRAT